MLFFFFLLPMPVTFEERVVGVWGFVSGGVEGQEVLEK